MNELTGIGKTRAMVDRWIAAKKGLRLARAEQDSKEEKFNIWFGSGILQVQPTGSNNYSVSWRKEPDGKDRLEHGV